MAIAADFLDAFSKLPKQTQAKTNSFISKFRQNPTSPGINYESIHNAADKNLKSVRVDGSYRAIVLKPETGNIYLLLWVDDHDEAYQWAQRKVCKINPESGALQIIDVEEVAAVKREIETNYRTSAKPRFADIHNRHLLRLGVPEELLSAVQKVVTDNDVDRLIDKLPEEAADAILLLAAGYSFDDVLNLQDKNSDKPNGMASLRQIVDEAQDMGTEAFSLLRAMIPPDKNDLFIVGDPHQRIYQHKVTLSHSGIEIRGRSRRLRLNYRTTDEIRKWASQVLSGSKFDDLDGGQNDLNDYRSLLHGQEPSVKGFKTFDDEIKYLAEQLQRIEQQENTLSSSCLMLRTRALIKSYSEALNSLGIKTHQIHRSQADDLTTLGLRLATMHRVKGLQFEYVLLAGLTKDELPPRRILDRLSDNRARLSLIERDRCLLHVAATRAKKKVLVTYHGQPSDLITNN